mmetsp:Transcript_44866/g.114706  ORF Transcript_44866/g.114706 Transcript_44866/m.114706 type:complete len:251 (-) Transcript_44866:1293-2045(-)
MRRDSWRSVPTTCRPPSSTTFFFSSSVTALYSASTRSNAPRSFCSVASSVGAFSHATLRRSSASSSVSWRSPQAATAASTASCTSDLASAESSAGYRPSRTFHFSGPLAPFSRSTRLTVAGSSISRIFKRAMNSGLPPSRMSVPRPAMLVAMVTAPARPLCATISDSRSTFSGLAFSSSKSMPSSRSSCPTSSLFSTLVVPTSTGRPFLCMRTISVTTDFHLPSSVRMTTSVLSSRITVRLGGTAWTSRR